MARGSTTPLHDAAGDVRAYRLKYDLPPHPGTGARRQRTETLHLRPGETVRALTKRADDRLAKALTEVAEGVVVADRTTTLAAYLTETWLPHYRTTVEAASGDLRSWAVRCWIVPHLGATKLAHLKAYAIQRAYQAMLAADLAPSSLRAIHAALNLALSQAVNWDMLPKNPCAGVDLPVVADPEEPPRALTPAEADALLTAARIRNDRFTDLYELAILTQLRIGELLALRWQDVDLAASVLRVQQSVKRKAQTVGKPKTKGSRRIVWLGPRSRELLAAQRLAQDRRREVLGDRWEEHDLVFDRKDGRLLSPVVVRDWLAASAVAAGIGHVTPHDLRHSGMTYLGREGVHPFVAGDRGGHLSLAMTRHYTHATAEWQREPALAVERVLASARDTIRDTEDDSR